MLNRIGNWYTVKVKNNTYNVLIQKNTNSVVCDPSSIIVLDEQLKLIDGMDSELYQTIEDLMYKVNFKYDMIN